ncbi:MAG: DUF262 domain-containing protein [Cyanobacteria bacterium J06639_14]
MSIQEAYRLYREGHLLVNRKYQRKLVWTISEKQRLIGSILKEYPIPLILLAERPKLYGSGHYEIIDGMQRLNAIFSFLENAFPYNNSYFDVSEFSRAKQVSDAGSFEAVTEPDDLLSPSECADIMDYQLAVTIYTAMEDIQITEVFGRINSSGKHLSSQEKRQAGITSNFSECVREIAIEARGDVTPRKVLQLVDMPEVSIDSKRSRQGYGVKAEETIWCKHGAITVNQLRDSEDEQMIADIAATILLGSPLPVSPEKLDALYNPEDKEFKNVEQSLAVYGSETLKSQIVGTISVLEETMEASESGRIGLRGLVNSKSSNPIKTAFYTVFMAFFELVVNEEKKPADSDGICNSLNNLQKRLSLSTHYTTTEARRQNIDQTKGLISQYFVSGEPSVLKHGSGLVKELENSLRRSRLETPRYEFKQGLLRLDHRREEDPQMISKIIETICGISNLGPDADGYLFIGVADCLQHAERIRGLDGEDFIDVSGRYVVGIEREANILGVSLDDYVKRIADKIMTSDLSEPLKTQVLSKFDSIDYRGKSVIRITVPAQKAISFVGSNAFTRMNNSTIAVDSRQLLSLNELFSKPRNT